MDAALHDDIARLEDAHWWFRGRREIVADVLRHRVGRGPLEILDLGSGTGGMLRMLGALGRVTGVESSDQALAYARERAPTANLIRGSLPDGIPGGRFDLITAFDVLEHLSDTASTLAAVKRSLSSSGAFVCTVPAWQFLWSHHDDVNHHHRRYTATLLDRELAAAGLELTWHSYFNAWLFPPVAAVRLLRRFVPEREGQTSMGEVPKPLNEGLAALFGSERFLLRRARLPFGVSLIGVARAQTAT